MADGPIKALVEGLIEILGERLIAQFKLESVVEFMMSVVGLAFIGLGSIGAWRGWW